MAAITNISQLGGFGQALANNSIISTAIRGVVADIVSPSGREVGGWTSAIASAFLTPFGVGNDSSTISAAGTVGNVAERIASAYPGLQVRGQMVHAEGGGDMLPWARRA
jgi:hypothetical protein